MTADGLRGAKEQGPRGLRSARGLSSTPEVARYRGRFGQLDWVLHRVTGLGVVLFLLIHVLDTSTVYFWPAAYDFFLTIYKNPIFGLGEVALGGALVFHAVNGVRVTVMDFWPRLWEKQPQARWLVWIGFALLFIPTAGVMFSRIIAHNLR